jgi:diguanylate cyclase (GGDEF)-like protein
VITVLLVLVDLSVVAIACAVLSQRSATKAQGDLEHLATHDPLTGLANRLALTTTLDDLLAARRPHGRPSLLLIELDRFPAINSTYGHDVGDELMVAASGQMLKALEPHEQLFRLGGAQFAVTCPAAVTREAALVRCAQLQASLRVQYRIRHDHLRVSTTAGIVVLDESHTATDILVEDAESALREAERQGAGSVTVFDESMRARSNPVDSDARLRAALERREFVMLYRPVVTLSDSRMAGVEALVGWADPEQGVVAPDEVRRLVERSDSASPIGDWSLTQACEHSRRWQQSYPEVDIATTINLSPAQLAEPGRIDRAIAIVTNSGADPQRLCLEISGGAIRNDIDLIWQPLRRAKDAGLQLGLGDFGTGDATFADLRKFALDVLKIDRAFVERVTSSTEDYAIVEQLISMLHELDIVAIAEGVTSAEQMTALATMHCDLAQGSYWGRPQPVEATETLIERRIIRPSPNRAKKLDWKTAGEPAERSSTRKS